MSDQRHDQQHGQQQPDHKREAPGAGQNERPQGGSERMPGEKPKTERASHQGGGHIRTDHQPQGK